MPVGSKCKGPEAGAEGEAESGAEGEAWAEGEAGAGVPHAHRVLKITVKAVTQSGHNSVVADSHVTKLHWG